MNYWTNIASSTTIALLEMIVGAVEILGESHFHREGLPTGPGTIRLTDAVAKGKSQSNK